MASIRSIDGADATAAVRDLIDRADRRVALSVPADRLDAYRDPLERALDRDVLVLVLAHSWADGDGPAAWSGSASIVRRSRSIEPVICTADERRGAIGPPAVVAGRETGSITLVTDRRLARLMFGSFMGNYWLRAAEQYVTDPDPLPCRYDSFYPAVLRATQALANRRPLRIAIETYPPGTIPTTASTDPVDRAGRLINARQSLLVPSTNRFGVENSLIVEHETGRFSVGGSGAIVEDYVGSTVRLEAVAD